MGRGRGTSALFKKWGKVVLLPSRLEVFRVDSRNGEQIGGFEYKGSKGSGGIGSVPGRPDSKERKVERNDPRTKASERV